MVKNDLAMKVKMYLLARSLEAHVPKSFKIKTKNNKWKCLTTNQAKLSFVPHGLDLYHGGATNSNLCHWSSGAPLTLCIFICKYFIDNLHAKSIPIIHHVTIFVFLVIAYCIIFSSFFNPRANHFINIHHLPLKFPD